MLLSVPLSVSFVSLHVHCFTCPCFSLLHDFMPDQRCCMLCPSLLPVSACPMFFLPLFLSPSCLCCPMLLDAPAPVAFLPQSVQRFCLPLFQSHSYLFRLPMCKLPSCLCLFSATACPVPVSLPLLFDASPCPLFQSPSCLSPV
jgi:hypothetical protein